MNAKRMTTSINQRFSFKIFEVIVLLFIVFDACICLQEQLYCV
jgi:hypothetical protein